MNMKTNYDMIGAIRNPFAQQRKKHGYTIQVGDETAYVSPEEIEEMNYPGAMSAIPREIRKRIRKAIEQDVSIARSGGIGVGAMIRLTGYDNDAQALYMDNPEKYIYELAVLRSNCKQRVEKLYLSQLPRLRKLRQPE